LHDGRREQNGDQDNDDGFDTHNLSV